MKIIKWIILAIALIVIFVILLFPYETYLKNLSQQIEKGSGVKITWSNFTFYLWKAEFKNIAVETPDGFKLFYEKIAIQPVFIGLKINTFYQGQKNTIILRKNKIDFDLKNLKLPDKLKLINGGTLNLKGYYYINKKIGAGAFILNTDNLVFADYSDKAVIVGNYEIKLNILNMEFDLNGVVSSGEGTITVDLIKDIFLSKIDGSAYLHYKGIGKKFNITGTLDNMAVKNE